MFDREVFLDIFTSVNYSIELILQRFDKIKTAADFKAGEAGLETLDSISMRLQFIGESLKKIEKADVEFLNQYSSIDWNKIINLRDFISHHYDMLNHEIIFDICKVHIPKLEIEVEKIIQDIKNKT